MKLFPKFPFRNQVKFISHRLHKRLRTRLQKYFIQREFYKAVTIVEVDTTKGIYL